MIADIKAKNYEGALTDALTLLPEIEAAYTDCLKKDTKLNITKKNLFKINKVGDLATCIADIEGLIPGVEKVIADVKAGNESQALVDLLALEAPATKAYTDCTASSWVKRVKDLPTCIADIEAMIPDVEAVIADFKAGN